VIHQAATLARHFNSEIVVLPRSDSAEPCRRCAGGQPREADWDLLAAIIRQAEKQQDPSLGPELDGLTIQRKLVKGDAAVAIVQTAEEEKADLIMMPSHSFTFYQFLMGSVTAKVLHRTACPVWTGAHVAASPAQKFAIRNVLCAIDFGPRTHISVSWAAQMAAEFGARLTLANVTAGWSCGGPAAVTSIKDERGARRQRFPANGKAPARHGHQADVFIGSGDVPKVLSQAAKQAKADLLVTGATLMAVTCGPRLRYHLRGGDSGSERVRVERPG